MPEVRFEAKAETVAVLNGYCSATGKCRTSFINQLLDDWAASSKFQVTVSKKYIGTYRTQQESECAYQDAAVLMLSSCSNFVAGVNPTESEDHRK